IGRAVVAGLIAAEFGEPPQIAQDPPRVDLRHPLILRRRSGLASLSTKRATGMSGTAPVVAILGFSIECNRFAPTATKADFLADTYLEGEAILAEARAPLPRMLPETPGFVAAMDASGPWQPVGIALAMAGPNGPVEHVFFAELIDTIERRLRAALPVDA